MSDVLNGRVATLRASGSASSAVEEWLPGASTRQHTVAFYSLSLPLLTGEVSGRVFGVASSEPIDTARGLGQLRRRLGEMLLAQRVESIRADLSHGSLRGLRNALVDSLSFDLADSSYVERFSVPLPVERLPTAPDGRANPSGATLLLGSDRTVVNIFTDGQVYVADPSQQSFAEVVSKVSILWRLEDDQSK